MTYTPRGNVKVILDAMAAQDPKLEWASAELAQLVGIEQKALPSTIKTALRNGVLFSEKRGRATFYSLTAYPEEEVEQVPFNAALWVDGDLVVYGAQANDDGSFTLAAAQLAQIKRLIAWSAAA